MKIQITLSIVFFTVLIILSSATAIHAQTFKNKKLEYLKTAYELNQNSFVYLKQCENMEAKIVANPYFLVNTQIIERELAKAMAGQDQSPERVQRYKNQLKDMQIKLINRAQTAFKKERCKSKIGREAKSFFEKMSAMSPDELKKSIQDIK